MLCLWHWCHSRTACCVYGTDVTVERCVMSKLKFNIIRLCIYWNPEQLLLLSCIIIYLWFRLDWNVWHYIETFDITLKCWTLHWNVGHYIETLDITLKRLTLHWNVWHYIETLDITLKRWTLHWNVWHYIETFDITLKHLTLHWNVGH